MSKLAAEVFIIFTLKVLATISLARYLMKWSHHIMECLVASYTIIYIAQIGLMLVLSPWHLVTRTAMYVGMGVLLISVVILSRVQQGAEEIHIDNKYYLVPTYSLLIMCIVVIFVTLAYRSFYFFDTTWDALTYELPRIFLYASYRTLFVHQSTQMINIFCNEWDGELNGLFYTIMTGNDQAVSFGNV